MKYIIHKFEPIIIAVNIHPIWLIDENERIFRNEIWFKPPIAPINAEEIITICLKKLFVNM